MSAQTGSSVSLSFSGTGSSGLNSVTLNGSGTLSPFGAAQVVASGSGNFGSNRTTVVLAFSFSFSDGSTITAMDPTSDDSVPLVLSGNATVSGGSGAHAGAAGSFGYTITAAGDPTTGGLDFTLTGSGTISASAPTCTVQASPSMLSFAALAGGDTAPSQTVAISTACASAVNFSATIDAGTAGSAAPAWISVSPGSGATPGALTVTASPGSMSAGTYPATIHITIPGNTGQAAVNIGVTFTISAASPKLDVSPGSLSLGAGSQTPTVQTQTIVIRNSGGGGALNFSAAIVGQSSWITSVTPGAGQTAPNAPVLVQVTVSSQGLKVGNFHDILRVTWSGGQIDIPVSLLVVQQGPIMSVSVNGLLFGARQGNGFSQVQTVSVLNLGDPTTTVNWTATVVSGSDWVVIGNATGASTPTSPGSFTVTAGGDASTLPVGGAYALIKISDSNTANPSLSSPRYVTAVLSIESAANPPEPHPVPAGLYFVSGSAAQTVNVFTSSTTAVAFQASASVTGTVKWLTVTPAPGMTSTQTPGTISVSASAAGLGNGIYSGSVNISESGLIRTVNVTFVVTGQATSPQSPDATGCTPGHLALTQTALSSNFQVPAGWPATMIVQLNDDCGNAVSNGSVVASFSNGDAPLTLAGDQHTNVYSATWQPGAVSPSMTVTIRGASGTLQPVTQIFPGAVQSNAFAPPTLIPGGTLHIFFNVPNAQALGYGLAPGNVAQVYGTGMASVAQSPGTVPLVTQFSGTFMLIGGIQAPLYYVSPGLINVQIPVELAPNRQYTAIVSANGALTLPETLTLVSEQPGMAANPDGTVIAQHAIDYSLVTAAHPAKPGEALIIYLAGMGATNPAVASGAVTPSQLVPAFVQPTMTVDGQPATIAYAGLTPTGIGLYQINFTVPLNARSGSLNVTVLQGGVPSNTSTLTVSN